MEYLKKFNIFVESKSSKPNIKTITDIDGCKDFVIYQGRDAVSNDHVTFVLSSDEDYWFHAKGRPGSHVLIKVKDKIPDEKLIYKVAEIAAKNSKPPKNEEGGEIKSDKEEVDVIYCKKKFVTKSEGMKPGQVAVDKVNSKTIKVKI